MWGSGGCNGQTHLAWLGEHYEGEWAELLSWWGCAATAVVIYLQCIVSQWASWKAGGAHLGSRLLSHRHCLHHHHGGRASFSWAGCPQVRVHRFRGPALTFVIVVVVNWRFHVRVFVFVCLRAVDEGHLWGW